MGKNSKAIADAKAEVAAKAKAEEMKVKAEANTAKQLQVQEIKKAKTVHYSQSIFLCSVLIFIFRRQSTCNFLWSSWMA